MSDEATEGMAKMSIKDRMKMLEAQSGGAAPGPFAGGGGPQTRGGGGRVAALRANVAVPSTPPVAASGATPTSGANAAGPGASGGGTGRVWQRTPAPATPATPAASATPAPGGGSGAGVASGGSCRSTGGGRIGGGKVAALGAGLKIPMGPMGGMGGMGGPKPRARAASMQPGSSPGGEELEDLGRSLTLTRPRGDARRRSMTPGSREVSKSVGSEPRKRVS